MKIRNGFVSNSSSSSFCIYGVGGVEDADNLESKIDELSLNLSMHHMEYYVYVGRSWDSIKDDETGRQFKDGVKADLIKLGIEGKQASTIEKAWYNG